MSTPVKPKRPPGAGGGIFAFPLLFPPPPRNGVVGESPTRQRVAGDRGIRPAVHSGSATVHNDPGRRNAFSGGQDQVIPSGSDHRDERAVVIPCERFGVLISPALPLFN